MGGVGGARSAHQSVPPLMPCPPSTEVFTEGVRKEEPGDCESSGAPGQEGVRMETANGMGAWEVGRPYFFCFLQKVVWFLSCPVTQSQLPRSNDHFDAMF